MSELKNWLNSLEYLPKFMRDFHDQKSLFKFIHGAYSSDDKPSEIPSWVGGHIYTVDWFLWFMASRGYTLQKSRKSLEYKPLPEYREQPSEDELVKGKTFTQSELNDLLRKQREATFKAIMNELDFDEEFYDRLHTVALNATISTENGEREMNSVQHWLAVLDEYGNATLSDGPHGTKEDVEQAKYLIERLNLGRGKTYAYARVEIEDIEAKPHGANEDAINTLNGIKRERKP